MTERKLQNSKEVIHHNWTINKNQMILLCWYLVVGHHFNCLTVTHSMFWFYDCSVWQWIGKLPQVSLWYAPNSFQNSKNDVSFSDLNTHLQLWNNLQLLLDFYRLAYLPKKVHRCLKSKHGTLMTLKKLMPTILEMRSFTLRRHCRNLWSGQKKDEPVTW